MRKLILGIALLLAVSAAAFANSPGSDEVTIKDWTLKRNQNPNGTAVLTGNELNGTDISINSGKTLRPTMTTTNVSDWLYNVNDGLDVLFLGFNSHNVATNIQEDPDDPAWNDKYFEFKITGVDPETNDTLMVFHKSTPDNLWTGDGVYHLDAGTIFSTYVNNREQYFGDERFLAVNRIELNLVDDGGAVIKVSGEGDPVRIGFFDLPEPSTYAYGVMGLASLIGLRRRVRK